jgi:hypothetical protein
VHTFYYIVFAATTRAPGGLSGYLAWCIVADMRSAHGTLFLGTALPTGPARQMFCAYSIEWCLPCWQPNLGPVLERACPNTVPCVGLCGTPVAHSVHTEPEDALPELHPP